MTKHTEGPWNQEYKPNGFVWGDTQIVGANKAVVARLYTLQDGFSQSDANASLIAAAPDLLAALKRAEGFIDNVVEGRDWEGCAGREILMDAAAAISKAGEGA